LVSTALPAKQGQQLKFMPEALDVQPIDLPARGAEGVEMRELAGGTVKLGGVESIRCLGCAFR
jgi:hypothetical protein